MKQQGPFKYFLTVTSGRSIEAIIATLLLGFSYAIMAQGFGPSYGQAPFGTSPAPNNGPNSEPYGHPGNFSAGRPGNPPHTLSLKGDQRMVARSDWPNEFILLLDDLQEHLVTEDEQDQFLSDLLRLDQAYSALVKNNKDSLNFLAKSLIYKGLLNWRPKIIVGPHLYSPTTLTSLKQRLTEEKFSPFLTWFLKAIERDLKIYFQEPTPKTQQAAAMALPWYQSFMAGKASFELDFYPAVRKTWHHLAEQLYLLAFFAVPLPEDRVSFKPSTSLPWKNFAKAAVVAAAAIATPTATNKIKKRISPVLAALWFATPDPNYTPPANLPQPVDDWNWRPTE